MKLLIVDDSRLNRALATNYIIDSGLEFEIIQAQSGEEAMAVLDAVDVDIILLDIVMPGIDGVQVLKNIKSDEQRSDIKVIMFTTLQEKEMLQTCFDLGASDFIQKPIEGIEFIARLKSIMRQRKLEVDTQKYIDEIKYQQTIISENNIQLMQQDKMAGVGQLAAGIAHEINNPLGFISSNFIMLKDYIHKFVACYKLLKTENPEEAYQSAIQYTNENDFDYIVEDVDELFDETEIGVDRVTQIVKSLRNFSHVDRTDSFDTYDINSGLMDTLIIANNSIKYAAEVTTDFGDVGTVYGIGSQINQVFLNLLVNAVYAIKEKYDTGMGIINVRTYDESNDVVIAIRDDGIGMSESTLRNLFNPFFTTKPVGDGTGLGLSISYDIVVTKHGGRIEVTSQVGEGTEFKVYLPKEM